jgi:acetyltransferase-like isoleucine patch superfamily enzyme
MKTRIKIGKYTYGEPRVFGKSAHCTIGKFCSIGENVRIDIGHEHNTKNISTYPFNVRFPEIAGHITTHPVCNGDVIIENDVWIGFDTIILSGAHICNGAVIGANSLVKGLVEPYTIYAGTPAEFKRYRFPSERDRELLQMVQWWDWPEHILFQTCVMELLMRNDVEALYSFWEEHLPHA